VKRYARLALRLDDEDAARKLGGMAGAPAPQQPPPPTPGHPPYGYPQYPPHGYPPGYPWAGGWPRGHHPNYPPPPPPPPPPPKKKG
jgi:hypothetical protein